MSALRYQMTMDTRRCVGCNACVLACSAENRLPEGQFRDWVVQETRGKFPNLTQEIRSERCHHCSRAPCVTVCPTGASHYGPGGTVLVAHNKCTGCKACMAACPYDARYVHPEGYVDKCTLCLHRLQRGKKTACVEICPTKALAIGDANRPNSETVRLVEQRQNKTLLPEQGTDPNQYFLV